MDGLSCIPPPDLPSFDSAQDRLGGGTGFTSQREGLGEGSNNPATYSNWCEFHEHDRMVHRTLVVYDLHLQTMFQVTKLARIVEQMGK